MKQKLIVVLLVVSMALNAYFIYEEVTHYRIQEEGRILAQSMGISIKNTSWQDGLKLLHQGLKAQDSSLLNKKYYYINLWTDWCKPCLREMPWLDSTAGTLNKDVGYFFVSSLPEVKAEDCIKKKNYHIKNFVYLNDMQEFVSAAFNELNKKSAVYPLSLLLTREGKIIRSEIGALENRAAASEFAKMINDLE